MRALIAVLGCCLLIGAPNAAGPAAAVAAPAARTVCRVGDSRIDEASGLARGIASPGVLYVNNDSGDTGRFFALDRRTCRTVATIVVRGARNVDWEDIAVARDAAGTPSVWLGDIGDNDGERVHVTVYRVPEPRLSGGETTRTVGVAGTWQLSYPGGPTDAESLAVAPGGTAYVVTKSLFGTSTVYRLPERPAGTVQPLQRVADVTLTAVGSSRFGVAGALLATGAAFSPDGTRFVIRTYSGAFVWTVRDGDLAAALRARPVTFALPDQPQGEGVTFDGTRLLLDSEGVGGAILSVPLPAAVGAAASTSAFATGSATASASGSASRSDSSSGAVSGSASPSPSGSGSPAGSYGSAGSWIPGLIILGLVIIGSILWWTGQRSRPARGPDR